MNNIHQYTVDACADESMNVGANQEVEGEAALALVGDGGLMSAASMQVGLPNTSGASQLALLGFASNACGQIGKASSLITVPNTSGNRGRAGSEPDTLTPEEKKKKAAAEAADRLLNMTPLEKAKLKMSDTLLKSTESKALFMQLDGMKLSSELSANMKTYADAMEKTYKAMRDLVMGKTNKTFDEPAFGKFQKDIGPYYFIISIQHLVNTWV